MMAARDAEFADAPLTGQIVLQEQAIAQNELFYTEGPEELKRARLQVAQFSLKRAAQRIHSVKRRRADPEANEVGFSPQDMEEVHICSLFHRQHALYMSPDPCPPIRPRSTLLRSRVRSRRSAAWRSRAARWGTTGLSRAASSPQTGKISRYAVSARFASTCRKERHL